MIAGPVGCLVIRTKPNANIARIQHALDLIGRSSIVPCRNADAD